MIGGNVSVLDTDLRARKPRGGRGVERSKMSLLPWERDCRQRRRGQRKISQHLLMFDMSWG